MKSTSKADGLYVYDTVQRLRDSRFDDKKVDDISAYIHLGPLGRAFASDKRVVLLIDEIDKADVGSPTTCFTSSTPCVRDPGDRGGGRGSNDPW